MVLRLMIISLCKEYNDVKFWDKLDYIGVQAYFPLVSNENPSLNQIEEGWKQHIPSLETIAQKYNRKILFTEMGYKSCTNSAIKPWEWIDNEKMSSHTVSLKTQENCYKAFFKVIWDKDWFGGVHLWKHRCDIDTSSSLLDNDFTPQGKPAQKVIRNGYSNHK